MSVRLEGEKISLHTFEFTDKEVEEITRWNNNQQNLTNTGRGSHISTMTSVKEYIEKTLKNEKIRAFAIRLGLDGNLIGTCDIEIESDPSNCVIGILIGDEEKQSKGYGTEVVKLLIKFAFDDLNAHRVHLTAREDNERAIKCYKKAGFVLCGVEHETQWSQGRWHNIVHMEILRDKWTNDNKQTDRHKGGNNYGC